MRGLILLTFIIGAVLFGACAESAPPTSTPAVESTPKPTPTLEPEEADDYLPWIAAEMEELNRAMRNLTYVYNYRILSRTYDEEEGEVLVHEFLVEIEVGREGEFCELLIPVPASALHDAKTHINNAYWLTNKSRLPDEVWEWTVSADEIWHEVSEATRLLKQQISDSYSYQVHSYRQIMRTEYTTAYPGGPLLPVIEKQMPLLQLRDIYDDYRYRLSEMISRLELVLQKLPSASQWGH